MLLGKIESAYFGISNGKMGLHVNLSFDGSGVSDSIEFWDFNQVKVTEHTRWTEAMREGKAVEVLQRVSGLLSAAKVERVGQLVNMPVEVIVDDGLLKSWRILEEVL